jgi:hypothetical protein
MTLQDASDEDIKMVLLFEPQNTKKCQGHL